MAENGMNTLTDANQRIDLKTTVSHLVREVAFLKQRVAAIEQTIPIANDDLASDSDIADSGL